MNLTDKQQEMADIMSCISEDSWSAGWLIGLEDILWDVIHDIGDRHWSQFMNIDQKDDLLRLIEETGGWIYFGMDSDQREGETYITLENWAHKKRKDDIC